MPPVPSIWVVCDILMRGSTRAKDDIVLAVLKNGHSVRWRHTGICRFRSTKYYKSPIIGAEFVKSVCRLQAAAGAVIAHVWRGYASRRRFLTMRAASDYIKFRWKHHYYAAGGQFMRCRVAVGTHSK